MSTPTAEEIALIQAFRERPEVFYQEPLGAQLYEKQIELLRAVRDYRQVACVGANSVGKDWTTGRLVLWWLATRYPAKAVVIGPTHRQVSDIVWRETRSGYLAACYPLGGHMFKTPRWEVDDSHFAVGFATNDEFNIQGFHSPHLLVILTEAHAMPQAQVDAVKRLNPARLLMTGNPLTDSGEFFDAFHTKTDRWKTVIISAFDTPNVQEGREVIPGLVTREQVEDRKADWGEESALYIAFALGQFGEGLGGGVVPLAWVRACQQLQRWYAPDDLLPVELGVDVGAGGDETVIRERCGVKAGRTWRYRTPDWAPAVGHIMQAIQETGATRVKVDVIGIGWGVVGRLKELRSEGKHLAEVIGVNVGEASASPSRFPKLRDQLWWEIGRELSQQQTWDLSAIDETTVAQLVAPRYEIDSSGRTKIEPKMKTRERLGRSPDDADALLLAFYSPRRVGYGVRFL